MADLSQENLDLFVDELKKISQLEEQYEKLNQNYKQIDDEFDDVKDFIDYDKNKIKRNVVSSDDKEPINPNYRKKNIILPKKDGDKKIDEDKKIETGKKIETEGKNFLSKQVKIKPVIKQVKDKPVIQQNKNELLRKNLVVKDKPYKKSNVTDIKANDAKVVSNFDDKDDKEEKQTTDKPLTGIEKRRYEIIGTFFAQGAVNEFRRIKNAQKFKDEMSTSSKNFSFKLKKIETETKADKKKGSFWGTLLKVLGLLGLIAVIFRDKIGNAFPNLKESVTGIFDNLKEITVNVIDGVMQYISNAIGSAFTVIVNKLLKETIPSIAGLFFNYTLPDILLRTYLAVLSTISESAADRLREQIQMENNDEAEEMSSYIVNNAENQIDEQELQKEEQESFENNQIKYFQDLEKEVAELAKTQYVNDAKVKKYMENLSVIVWGNMESVHKNAVSTFEKLADAITTEVGAADVNIRDMIDKGQFDISNFMLQYKTMIETAKSNGKKYTTQDKNKLIVKLMAEEILKNKEQNEKFTEDKISKVVEKMGGEQQNEVAKFVNDMYEQKEKMAQDIVKIIDERKDKKDITGKKEEKTVEGELEKINKNKDTVIITFDELKTESYKTEATQKLTNILEKISNFITGGTKNSLVKIIQLGMNNIKDFYKNFLSTSMAALYDAVKQVGDVFFKTGYKRQSFVENVVQGDNNLIINIDMNQSNNTNLNAPDGISSENNSIIETLNQTNDELKRMIKTVNGINDLHTASKTYVEHQLKKDSKSLPITLQTVQSIAKEQINTVLFEKQLQDTRQSSPFSPSSIPLTMRNMV